MRFTACATTVASVCGIGRFLMLCPFAALGPPVRGYGYAATMALGSAVLPVFNPACAGITVLL